MIRGNLILVLLGALFAMTGGALAAPDRERGVVVLEDGQTIEGVVRVDSDGTVVIGLGEGGVTHELRLHPESLDFHLYTFTFGR